MQIIVRHMAAENGSPNPPFSDRALRALSSGALIAAAPPDTFCDSVITATGATIAEAVYLSGMFEPPALCSGIGRCGLCRVRFISPAPPALPVEMEALSHHDIESGWRLGCRHAPTDGMHVLIPAPPLSLPAGGAAPATHEGALAVDFGTTSIHWQTLRPDAPAGPATVAVNPQMGAGSDVISRLAAAATPSGAAALRRLALAALARMVRESENNGARIRELCIAANPAMTAILLGLPTTGLARAPYALPLLGGESVALPDLPPAYIPPLIAPFIGGDTSAGYAALALDPHQEKPDFPFLLADLGTNGECVLALSPTEALAASVPMGPALEGINLRFGTAAAPGAITAYSLTPYGLEPTVLGDTAPIGITATGYLSLLRALRAAGIMTDEGMFSRQQGAPPLAGRIDGEEAAEPRIRLPGKMVLTASDVEEILKVKAAFTLAVSRLLKAASLPPAQLRRFYLAGSLGTHAPIAALSDLGFLPPGTEAKVAAVGNTALAGAALFLEKPETRESCRAWAAKVATVAMTDEAALGEDFARHMIFSWRA